MKYSINSIGFIVAERDIYSLGGFIPKGSVGAKVANEDQISQDGECWVAGGDISARPDVRVKDNAYIGTFTPGANPVHTDGITEFSGNTLIPGNISVRSFVADTKNNFFAKDSFIGVSMDVLCGPAATTTAFPFEQGRYNQDAPKGTLFTSSTMKIAAENCVRNTATLMLGKNTYVYTPVGFNARIYWAYVDATGQLAYAGESLVVSQVITKLDHPVYRVCMVVFARNPTLTPTDLLATGAKILGHINSSRLIDARPESASGQYVMDKSSFLMNTDNFRLATNQLRFLAGSMYDTTMYTKTDRQDYKPYGTFRNIERLEYTKYLPDLHRTAATRDTYISAYDCPLLRIGENTYDAGIIAAGGLILRRCIVPKGCFRNDVINGNTYEDLDFSYANEDLEYNMPGYTDLISSHREGIYRLQSGPSSMGFVSHKGNLADTARLLQAEVYIPLDGSIMEQGAYDGNQVPYESVKAYSSVWLRTGKPLPTFGLVLPSLPAGYLVKVLHYLDEDFIIRSTVVDPTGLDTTYPYVVMAFRRDDNSAINVTDFIALNLTLRMIDHTKAPEITGSAYVGAGCTVRGDVQLHGDPYVNRVFDINEFDRGGVAYSAGKSWGEMKDGSNPSIRMSSKHVYPVSPGDTISLTGPYRLGIIYFNADKKAVHDTGWSTGALTVPDGCFYMGLSFSSSPDGKFIDFSDIPLANVKYVRAFKKRRYITNELDRTSPEDILLSVDYWEQGRAVRVAGATYEALKSASVDNIRLKLPVNTGMGAIATKAAVYGQIRISLDALTKCVSGEDMIVSGTPLVGTYLYKVPLAAITPADVTAARLVIDFTPSPRIVVPYGSSNLFISGPKIRMYDNAVLSRNLNQEGGIVLSGEAVMGYDFNAGSCMCSNGHSDAIIKLP